MRIDPYVKKYEILQNIQFLLIQIYYFLSQKMTQKLKSLLKKIKEHPKLSMSVVVSILLGYLIRKHQHHLIYRPDYPRSPSANKPLYQNPINYDQDLSFKIIDVKTSDGVALKGWYIQKIGFDEEARQRLILYFHQNIGNIGTKLPLMKQFVKGTDSDVMIVAYRGYSDSQGKPSEEGLKQDGIAILNKAIEIAKRRKIPLIVYGRDLGGAVAIHSCSQLASQQQVKGLILQNTFTSIHDIAVNKFSKIFPQFLIKFFLFFLLTNHWQSYKLIDMIKSPVLFIKSAKDELIPIQQMNQLQNLCKAKHHEYVIERGTHNMTWNLDCSPYLLKVNNFIKSL